MRNSTACCFSHFSCIFPLPQSMTNPSEMSSLVFGFTGVKAVCLCVYPDLWVFVYPLVICVSNPSILRCIKVHMWERHQMVCQRKKGNTLLLSANIHGRSLFSLYGQDGAQLWEPTLLCIAKNGDRVFIFHRTHSWWRLVGQLHLTSIGRDEIQNEIQKAAAHILGQEREVDCGWVDEWGYSMLKKIEGTRCHMIEEGSGFRTRTDRVRWIVC